jgi:hypothetical protein
MIVEGLSMGLGDNGKKNDFLFWLVFEQKKQTPILLQKRIKPAQQ